jgi:hypothetical protein
MTKDDHYVSVTFKTGTGEFTIDALVVKRFRKLVRDFLEGHISFLEYKSIMDDIHKSVASRGAMAALYKFFT